MFLVLAVTLLTDADLRDFLSLPTFLLAIGISGNNHM
jgi:hypothetical protein